MKEEIAQTVVETVGLAALDAAEKRSCGRCSRCGAAILWFLTILILTAGVGWAANELLKETRSYIESQRTPVMLPGGAAKF
jgi:hypothetical protein